MLKKSLGAFIVLAGMFVLLLYPKVYVLRGSAGGGLYWNANEALLFMTGGTSGAHMSYPRYLLEPLLMSMGDVRPADNESCSQTLVIRVTDKDFQRYETDLYRYADEPYCGFNYVFFGGHFYAVSWPRLLKWSGTTFERPTPEEYGAYATALSGGKIVSQHPWEFDNVDGWSMRGFGQTPPKYDIVLNGQPVTVVFHGETWPPRPLSVDLIRPGQRQQTIWSFDGRPRRVSRAE
jgi:hypothetical protein